MLARLQMHLRAKLALLIGLAVGICVPYFSLQQIRAFPVRTC